VSEDDKFSIPDELESWIGLKKSEYLSLLIENLPEGDFGFEEYHLFDDKIQGTVETPDRSYEEVKDGNPVETFVRTYSDSKMFHHVVIGTTYIDRKNELEIFLPILTFVTRSEELVGLFSVGRSKSRPTLN
jgi:hypothetical protein